MSTRSHTDYSRISRCSVSGEVGGRTFTFALFTRRILLGPDVPIQYYWMDASRFRVPRARLDQSSGVCADITEHWWTVMQITGAALENEQIGQLCLAACYPLVAGSHSLQNKFLDARLKADKRGSDDALPEAVSARIRTVMRARDREALRAELAAVLGPPVTNEEKDVLTNRAVDLLVGSGVQLVREKDVEGLFEFVDRTDQWLATRRKRGGEPDKRAVADAFAIRSKLAFYTCYTNAWVSMIPWLREQHGLDETSERFLRVWNMQNPPVRLSNGQWLPDVMAGHILALHPLSGFLMLDSALRQVAGRFFAGDAYERALRRGEVADCPEYWQLCGAIVGGGPFVSASLGFVTY